MPSQRAAFTVVNMRAPLMLVLLFSAASALAADVPGANPVLARFAGSELIAFERRESDDFELQTSTFRDYSITTKQRSYVEPPLRVHGAHATLWYQATGYVSAADVMQHYLNELGAHGFEVLYDSSSDPHAKKAWANGFLTAFERSAEQSAKGRWAFNGADSQSVRTLTARHTDAKGTTYVSLLAVEWPEDVGAYEAKRGAYVALDVIESAATNPSAAPLGQTLDNAGHIAIYDVDAQLAAIVQLMKDRPTLQLYVVAHDDTLAASKKRAQAVVDALVHAGIAKARLSAEGVGPLAPIASNTSEQGRALNRRVELVIR